MEVFYHVFWIVVLVLWFTDFHSMQVLSILVRRESWSRRTAGAPRGTLKEYISIFANFNPKSSVLPVSLVILVHSVSSSTY